MTPKQRVKAARPNAGLWWQPGKASILSKRENGIVDFIGAGPNPRAAWKNAAERLPPMPENAGALPELIQ